MDEKVYQSLLEIFSQELTDCHHALITTLLKIEKGDEKTLQEDVQLLFRTAHNVKGAAKSVSLNAVATLAHQLEDIVSKWRDGKYKPNNEDIADCLALSDQLLSTFSASTKNSASPGEILKIPL